MDIFAEPLIDVPVGKTSRAKSDTADLSEWNKMTLKDIFEDENLFKITILSDNDEKNKTEIKYEEDAKESMVRVFLFCTDSQVAYYFFMANSHIKQFTLFVIGL